MKLRTLTHQETGRLIGWLCWMSLVLNIGLAGLAWFVDNYRNQYAMHFVIIAVFNILVTLFAFQIGRAVRNHKTWGRIAGMILSAWMLLFFPVGTVFGLYILWNLIRGWNSNDSAVS